MNRMNNRIPRLAAFGLMLVAIAACTKTDINPNDDLTNPSSGDPIAFETEDPFTKAVVYDKDDLQVEGNSFLVWSWFQGTKDGRLFEQYGTPVTYAKDDDNVLNWTYGTPRYWMNGTYNFAAVYPSTVSGTYEPAENTTTPVILNVNDYNIANQDDLLVAFYNRAYNGNDKSSVNFEFHHALSRVKLQINLDEDDFYTEIEDDEGNVTQEPTGYAYVTAVGFNNISKTASLSVTPSNESSWPLSSSNWSLSSTKDDILIEYTDENVIQLDTEFTDLYGQDGLFAIPQVLDENNPIELYFKVNLIFPGISNRTIIKEYNIGLNTLAIQEWEPNKVYLYYGTINQEFEIQFNVVKVHDWEDDTLGGLIIN